MRSHQQVLCLHWRLMIKLCLRPTGFLFTELRVLPCPRLTYTQHTVGHDLGYYFLHEAHVALHHQERTAFLGH